MSNATLNDDPTFVRPTTGLNELGLVPPRNLHERIQAHSDGLIPKLIPLLHEFRSKAAEYHNTYKNGIVIPKIEELRASYKSKGAEATKFSANTIRLELEAAQKAMPPASPPAPAKDDLRANLESREIRDRLKEMDSLARPLFFIAAAKSGRSNIVSAVLNDPCFVPTFNELLKPDVITEALGQWRLSIDPQAFERLDSAQRANQFLGAVMNSFNRKISAGGMEP